MYKYRILFLIFFLIYIYFCVHVYGVHMQNNHYFANLYFFCVRFGIELRPSVLLEIRLDVSETWGSEECNDCL